MATEHFDGAQQQYPASIGATELHLCPLSVQDYRGQRGSEKMSAWLRHTQAEPATFCLLYSGNSQQGYV